MQHSGQNGDPIKNARHGTSPSKGARRAESGAAVVLVALLGFAGVSAVGCEGEDTTSFPPQGGSSGSGGSGVGGTTAGASGNAGSSGASGAGGSTAGTGGSGGSNAGTGGTSAGGTGGTDGELPDGGLDSGAPDADVQLSQREITGETICATGDSLDDCNRTPTCLEDYLGFYTGFLEPTAPDCVDEADAYFECQAAQPATAYQCAGTPLVPEFIAGTEACLDEETAFFAGFEDPANCAD